MIYEKSAGQVNIITAHQFARSVTRWMAAGRPTRTPERIAEILADHCDKAGDRCPQYQAGRCNACGCPINNDPTPLTNKLAMATEPCPADPPRFAADHKGMRPRWIDDAERLAAAIDLAAQLPADITAVAGVGRSGIAPAMILAERLHLTAYAIDERAQLTALPNGWRLDQPDRGRLLVLDDTIATGRSFAKLTANLASRGPDRDICTAALFVNPEHTAHVDYTARTLPLPHYLAWNFFNSVHTATAGLDFDGIICHDPDRGQCDAPADYLAFCENARPKWLPRKDPVALIATARPEAMREATEKWLRRYGVAFDRLEMAPDHLAAADRWKHKITAIEKSQAEVFVESDPRQALEIARLLEIRVICPESCEIWN
jgi:orotate phosphoribosyltransferase